MTDRLVLNYLEDHDAAVILALRSDPEVNRYIDRPAQRSLDEAVSFVNKIKKGYLDASSYYWAIRSKEEKKMIGAICLWNFSADGKTAELGYEMSPGQQGKGFTTEAVNRVIEFALAELALTEIRAYTHPQNLASIKILEKFSFKPSDKKNETSSSGHIIFILSETDRPFLHFAQHFKP
jgi:ribosomal-protein-alanine N-acetyltransferase